MKKILFLLSAVLMGELFAAQWKMAEVKIVMPENPNKFQQLAKEELEFHLQFVAGKLAPGNEFTMVIGSAPAGAPKPKSDESIYIIDGKTIYFYGDDGNARRPKNGSQLAVYTFFKKYFNMRYLRAGNDWVFGDKKAVIDLPEKEACAWVLVSATPSYLNNNREYLHNIVCSLS